MAKQRTGQIAVAQLQVEPPVADPTHEEIATLAYFLWQARGCPDGVSEEDWLNAENVLKADLQG